MINERIYKMSNEDLDNAIDTAAKFSSESYLDRKRASLMLPHLEFLLEVQKMRVILCCREDVHET